MKLSNLSKVVGAAILTCSLAALPSNLPASAQSSTSGGSTNGTATDNSTTGGTTGTTQSQGTDNTDRGFDWGWLGLIGLAGLAGLARKREEPVRYRDPGTVGTTGTNYRE